MNELPTLTSFLGWTLLLNIGFLVFATIMLLLFKTKVSKIHGRLFNMNEELLSDQYFRFLANYKLLITVFNLAPWLALKLMAAG